MTQKSTVYIAVRAVMILLFIIAAGLAALPFIDPPQGKWGGLVVFAYLMASGVSAALGALASVILWLMRRHTRKRHKAM